MAVNYNPRIVTDRLVLALDAGNTKSFNNTSPDGDFSSVSLLLNGNGSNGSTTITDSSTHNHSITVNGNAQISTAQSKFGGSSMLFDGDGDYVRAANSSEFAFGTGDFTVEAWLRGTGSFYETRTSISQAPGFGFGVSNNTIKIWDGQGQSFVYDGSTTYDWTDWHHVAVSRSGTTLRVFVDGSLDGTATTSRDLTHQGAIIGANINRVINGSGGDSFNGYIDDVRITKGVARYTSNFTPPTSQHPAGPVWTDTIGGNTGTLTGEPTFSSRNGGYLDFDGTDDFVTLGTQINSDITTTNVTISFWAYIDSTAADEVFVSMETLNINIPLIIWYDTSSTYEVQNTGTGDVGGGSTNVITTAVTDASSEKRFTTSNNALSANTWYNIVVVLDVTNNEFYTYINGVEEAKWVSNNTSGGIKSTTNDFRIGGGSPYLDGRISNFSVYNKALTAVEVQQNYNALRERYVPYIVTSGLILHLDAANTNSYSGSGNTWTDLSGQGNNATRTNSNEVVYNSSGWFDWTDGPGYDSTQGCFTLPGNSFTLGANFTIEVWNYYDSSSAPTTNPWNGGNLWTNSADADWSSGAGNNNGLLFGYNSIRYRNTSGGETGIVYSSNPTTQVWHQHVLVVNSGTATVYVDKVSVATASNFRTYTQSNGTLGIGIADLSAGKYRGEYLGFISNVKIYSQALSTSEIEQNYDALIGRYGI